MYTYGLLFFVPINVLYIMFIVVNGVIKKRPSPYYIFAFVLGVYANFLIKYAFFPIFIPGEEHYTALVNYINMDIALLFSYSAYQIIGNVLLTFPLGILLAFITNYNVKERIVYTILLSASLELIQLIIISSLHSINITFDINDIILNMMGGVVGNIFFYLFCKIYIRIPCKEEKCFLILYFNQVCTNCANHKKSFSA